MMAAARVSAPGVSSSRSRIASRPCGVTNSTAYLRSVAAAYEQVLSWLERVRQRRHLAQLSDHMLKDIGLTRVDVEAELSKPFWRA